MGMDRTDGYQLAADVTIQGVRAYDPTTAQWTSPDAYAGTTTDPGSQKPFMWDGNNPIAYSDPSGYDIVEMIARYAGVPGQAHVYIKTIHHGGKTSYYSFASNKSGGFLNMNALSGDLKRQKFGYDAS